MSMIPCPTPTLCGVIIGHVPGSADALACQSRRRGGSLGSDTLTKVSSLAGTKTLDFIPSETMSHPRVNAERDETGKRRSLSAEDELSYYPLLAHTPESLRLESSYSGGTMLVGEAGGTKYGIGLPSVDGKGRYRLSGFNGEFDGDYDEGKVAVFVNGIDPFQAALPRELNAQEIALDGAQSAFLVDADPEAAGAVASWVESTLREQASKPTVAVQDITETPAIGTCPACGTVISRLNGAKTATCPGCQSTLKLKRVQGTYNPDAKCTEASCLYARANMCSCSCGGAQHGAGYSDEDSVPEEIRERDKARFEGREEAARVRKEAAESERAAAEAEYQLELARTRAEELAATLAEHPSLQYLMDVQNTEGKFFQIDFLADLAEQLDRRGYLSPRQIEAAERIIPDEQRKTAREERKHRLISEAMAKGLKAPLGKAIPVQGQVEAVYRQTNSFSGLDEWKMRIRSDEGWSVAIGVNKKLEAEIDRRFEAMTEGKSAEERRGMRWQDVMQDRAISISSITLKPSNDDLHTWGTYAKIDSIEE